MLDRFNMDHAPLRDFNAYYVRCVSKYFPTRNISPYCRAPARTLDELLKMTPKQMLGGIQPGKNDPFSHVHWDFYVFPVRIL